MRPREPKHESPCPELQDLIDKLKWAKNSTAQLTNLPKGKLREHLKSEIDAIINYEGSPLEEKLTFIRNLADSMNSLQQKLRETIGLRKVSPDTMSELLHVVDTVLRDVEGLRESCRNDLFR